MNAKIKWMMPVLLLCLSNTVMGQGEQVLEVDSSDAPVVTTQNDTEVTMTESGDVETFSVDKIYTIQSGDTLWDICTLLLDDPYYWPKLWSLNQYILNPHLIFPGDRLVFTPGTESSFPDLEIVKDGEQMVFEVVQGKKKKKETNLYKEIDNPFGDTVVEKNIATGQGVSIRLVNKHILAPKGVKTVGKITHSGEPKMNLVYNDRVYLDFFRSDYKGNVQVGQKFFVTEKIKKVRNPGGGGRIGELIQKKAVVQVTDIRTSPRNENKKVYEGVVLDAEAASVRGDEIMEYRPEIRQLVPFYTEDIITGHIAEADKQQLMISNNDFVFLNIGLEDGLRDGMQLYVVRRGDGLGFGGDKHLPDVPVGRIMIVEAWDTVATAYVVSLDQALTIGDRVTTVIE